MCEHCWGRIWNTISKFLLIENGSHRCPLPVFLNWRLSAPNNEQEYTANKQLNTGGEALPCSTANPSSSVQLARSQDAAFWPNYQSKSSNSYRKDNHKAEQSQSAFLQVHSGTSVKSKKVSFISCEWLVTIYHNVYNWLEHFLFIIC